MGFDIQDIPWSIEGFGEEKRFILAAIEAAKIKHRWGLLDYTPREDWIISSLEQFAMIVEDFSVEFVLVENYRKWQENKPDKTETCPIHGVYHHWQGCVVCNN